MTLGECVFFLEKCTHRNYPMTELKQYIDSIVSNTNTFYTESYDETYVLVTTALYLESLEQENVLNWNIPNENKYRRRLLNTNDV